MNDTSLGARGGFVRHRQDYLHPTVQGLKEDEWYRRNNPYNIELYLFVKKKQLYIRFIEINFNLNWLM